MTYIQFHGNSLPPLPELYPQTTHASPHQLQGRPGIGGRENHLIAIIHQPSGSLRGAGGRGRGQGGVEEKQLQGLAVEGEGEGAEEGWREGRVHLHTSSQGEGRDD